MKKNIYVVGAVIIENDKILLEHTVYEYDFAIVHLTTFYCKLVEGRPVLTEYVAMKWLSSEELISLDWAPADLPAIQKLKETFLKRSFENGTN